jgi:hypothetical protein
MEEEEEMDLYLHQSPERGSGGRARRFSYAQLCLVPFSLFLA